MATFFPGILLAYLLSFRQAFTSPSFETFKAYVWSIGKKSSYFFFRTYFLSSAPISSKFRVCFRNQSPEPLGARGLLQVIRAP